MHFEMINIILPSFFIIILFWLLFIEEVFPGKGYSTFSLRNVDIKVRILSFCLFIGLIICAFRDERLFAGILALIAFCLLIFD